MMRLTGTVKHENAAMDEGKFVHQVIYEYTKHCIEHGIDSDFELIDQLIDKHFDNAKLSESVYINARQNLLEFGEVGIDIQKVLDFERHFRVETPGYTIEGYIDRVNTEKSKYGALVEIIDYKNQRNIMTENEVKENLQLMIYKYIAAKHLYPWMQAVRVGIYHVRYNYIQWTKVQTMDELIQEFEGVEKFLQREWKRLIHTPDDQYSPQKGVACWEYGFCEVMKAGKCPLFKQSEVDKMLESPELEDQVRGYLKSKDDAETVKKKIASRFKNSDPVKVDGKEIGYKQSTSCKYSIKDLLEFGNQYNIDFYDLQIASGGVEKIIKDACGIKSLKHLDENMKVDLENIQEWSFSNRFSI